MTETLELKPASKEQDYADRTDLGCGIALALAALAAFFYGIGHEPYAHGIERIFVYCFGYAPGLNRSGFYVFIMMASAVIIFFGILIGVNLSFKVRGKKSSR